MLASVIATRPSILTRLSTIDCGTAAFVTSAPIVSAPAPFARVPIRMLAVPASPTSVTMLPAPPGCGSTRGGSDDGRTETSGLIRGVFTRDLVNDPRREGGSDHTDEADAAEHQKYGDDLASGRGGGQVSVPDGGDRGDRPPHRIAEAVDG